MKRTPSSLARLGSVNVPQLLDASGRAAGVSGGGGAAAQPSLMRKQAALVGKGSLSSFDHFREKEPQAEKSFGKSLKKSHCALAAKDNTLARVRAKSVDAATRMDATSAVHKNVFSTR
jgi:hypothetical protein